MITIVDYGVGNLNSIRNMLKKIGVESVISTNNQDILKAEKLILPGVGKFGYGMQQLEDSGLLDSLNNQVIHKKVPILGICLGMQLFARESEESPGVRGLGWINGVVKKFEFKEGSKNKIPHMGWTSINVVKESNLFNPFEDEKRFYFVHSYHLSEIPKEEALCTSNYGYEFVCGVQKENIYGMQFHPEKSHRFGKQLLSNFAKNI